MSSPTTPPGSVQRGSPWSQELISHLQPYATLHHVQRGEQFDFCIKGQGMCYLIIEGSVALYRRSNNMLLSTANSPAVFGLANMTDIYFDDYFKTIKPCTIGVLPIDKVNDICKENDLWGLVSRHMMFVYNRLYHHVMPAGAPTAYELIRKQLLELMDEDEGFRARITAEKYIRDKTQLSRSGVMRILADLKAGGYVEMKEGRLIKIIKLPAKY
ncbi:helix-turn-helix domain-containing protein [Leclercia adecarboxylata]|uniref:winged helix-turn-helix transcriptional regulator n=1 Tax=Leclercia adecarboxylata TaxID=83655 RepID=UPI002DB81F23|nr:helix-turn-helix domain-containing protein [Leclercia adecarboxylata]MEB6377362.1 helix-turn-helix domain-containing protein [Leclercia adecarboxylata]